jgi:hypothetical protein
MSPQWKQGWCKEGGEIITKKRISPEQRNLKKPGPDTQPVILSRAA